MQRKRLQKKEVMMKGLSILTIVVSIFLNGCRSRYQLRVNVDCDSSELRTVCIPVDSDSASSSTKWGKTTSNNSHHIFTDLKKGKYLIRAFFSGGEGFSWSSLGWAYASVPKDKAVDVHIGIRKAYKVAIPQHALRKLIYSSKGPSMVVARIDRLAADQNLDPHLQDWFFERCSKGPFSRTIAAFPGRWLLTFLAKDPQGKHVLCVKEFEINDQTSEIKLTFRDEDFITGQVDFEMRQWSTPTEVVKHPLALIPKKPRKSSKIRQNEWKQKSGSGTFRRNR